MPFKPVGVDENGNFGPRVDKAISKSTAKSPAVFGKLGKNEPLRAGVPLVVFTFDDNPLTDKTVVKPLLDELGIKATFAVTTNFLASNKLTWSDLRQFQSEGHEIANHGVAHANLTAAGTTRAQVKAEIENAHNLFVQNGIDVSGMVYAFGNHDATVREISRNLYKYGASVGSAANKQPFKTYGLGRKGFNLTSTLAAHQAEIDSAIANNEVVVYLTHSVSEFDAAAQQKFRDLVAYIKSKGVAITTLSKAMDTVGNLLDLGDYTGNSSYTVVDGLGRVFSSDLQSKNMFTRSNAITNATPPSDFYAGGGNRRVYFDVVNTGNNPTGSGFPQENVIANIITMTLNPDPAQAWQQQLFISDGGMWQRRGNTDAAWSSWKSYKSDHKIEGYAADAAGRMNRTPATYSNGTTISQLGPNSGVAPGPTVNSAGILRTNKVSDTFYVMQEFFALTGEIYTRMSSNSDGASWSGTWKKITNA